MFFLFSLYFLLTFSSQTHFLRRLLKYCRVRRVDACVWTGAAGANTVTRCVSASLLTTSLSLSLSLPASVFCRCGCISVKRCLRFHQTSRVLFYTLYRDKCTQWVKEKYISTYIKGEMENERDVQSKEKNKSVNVCRSVKHKRQASQEKDESECEWERGREREDNASQNCLLRNERDASLSLYTPTHSVTHFVSLSVSGICLGERGESEEEEKDIPLLILSTSCTVSLQ